MDATSALALSSWPEPIEGGTETLARSDKVIILTLKQIFVAVAESDLQVCWLEESLGPRIEPLSP